MEHVSLDGVIQHSADDGDFPYSGWTAPYRTPAGRDGVLAAQGERFDIRAFHDQVLGSGAVPLDTLEARIRGWISAAAPSSSS